MIRFFYVFQYIFLIKQHVFKLPFGVHFSLVSKMFRIGVAALPTCQKRFGFYCFTKLYGANKTIAIHTIPLFSACEITCIIRWQHTPSGRRKPYGYTRLSISIFLVNIA